MINRLVVNGCSYLYYYTQGNGHVELAHKLGIEHATSLAVSGSCNRRIIRSTLRDSYTTTEPTLYVIGTTFLSRFELPALQDRLDPDGKWVSFVGANPSLKLYDLDHFFTEQNLNVYADLHDKFNSLSLSDIAIDLMFSMLSLIDSLKNNGHKIVLFNTAEHTVDYFIDQPEFDLIRQRKEIIGGYSWRSIPWQFEQGAKCHPGDEMHPADCRHVAAGQHQYLNTYLTDYIQEHKILA